MKRNHMDSCTERDDSMGYGKIALMDDQEMDAGMDELLAVLGYKLRYSDMEDVAQKLEQLDRAMGSSTTQEDALIIASDAVHYNPSDLSSWVESMLSEINNPNAFDLPPAGVSSSYILSDPVRSLVDLSPITFGGSAPLIQCGLEQQIEIEPRDRKRMKTSSTSSSPHTAFTASALPMVTVEDSQEAGICLVHALLACAEAVQEENYKSADAIMNQISVLTSSQRGAMQKVAGYFAEALSRRIYRFHPNQDSSLDSAFSDILQIHFYESCPYLKFAHFTANQAILEAFSGFPRVHVIDFGIKQGMQWPALMQALALRPGGPPSFRLTGISPPLPDNSDHLQQLGWQLSHLAETLHIDFEFRGFVADSVSDIEPYMLESPSGNPEAVAINSVFELHNLLAIPGGIDKTLDAVRSVNPRIFTVVEQEADHNDGELVGRFTNALHYYSTLFDSLEGGDSQAMTEVFLGRQICNVVACEGTARIERHETLDKWSARMGRAGFGRVHLGSNAFKQASMLLAMFAGGDGYRVEERDGCLTLGWHTCPLIATSAWRVAGAGQPNVSR